MSCNGCRERALRNDTYRVRLALQGLRSSVTIIVTTYLLVLGKYIYRTQALFICSDLDVLLDMQNLQVKINITRKTKGWK